MLQETFAGRIRMLVNLAIHLQNRHSHPSSKALDISAASMEVANLPAGFQLDSADVMVVPCVLWTYVPSFFDCTTLDGR